jgi:hypothetical protein
MFYSCEGDIRNLEDGPALDRLPYDRPRPVLAEGF